MAEPLVVYYNYYRSIHYLIARNLKTRPERGFLGFSWKTNMYSPCDVIEPDSDFINRVYR